MKPSINISRVPDQVVRSNFASLKSAFDTQALLNADMLLIPFKVVGNHASFKTPHNLNFNPTDALLTSAIWSGAVGTLTINYDEFDGTNISVTVAGQGSTDQLDLRILVGRFS